MENMEVKDDIEVSEDEFSEQARLVMLAEPASMVVVGDENNSDVELATTYELKVVEHLTPVDGANYTVIGNVVVGESGEPDEDSSNENPEDPLQKEINSKGWLTTQQKAAALIMFLDKGRSIKEFQRCFEMKYPGLKPPTRSGMYKYLNRFKKTGSVITPVRRRQKRIRTPETIEAVRQAWEQQSPQSLRALGKSVGVSQDTVRRILVEDLGQKPGKLFNAKRLKALKNSAKKTSNDKPKRRKKPEFVVEIIRQSEEVVQDGVVSSEGTVSIPV